MVWYKNRCSLHVENYFLYVSFFLILAAFILQSVIFISIDVMLITIVTTANKEEIFMECENSDDYIFWRIHWSLKSLERFI